MKQIDRRLWLREATGVLCGSAGILGSGAGVLGSGAGAAMVLGLSGCSSAPQKPAEPPPPPEPVSALKAFTAAYGRARSRGGELEILSISNINIKTVPSKEGKSGVWQFQFVSHAKRTIYNIRYAVVDELPSFREGAWDSGTQGFDPRGMRARPFPVAAMRCDSTTAWEIAEKEANDFIEKNKDVPVNFLLELTDVYQLPTWRVYWGNSLSTAMYSVYVDANQSKFVKKGKG